MKQVLLISFDLIREGESQKTLSIASLMAYLKNDGQYGNEFIIHHLPFNLVSTSNLYAQDVANCIAKNYDLRQLDFIAISAYVWSDYLINPVIKHLRDIGFKNSIILGGCQISYSNQKELVKDYPDAQIFIMGYGENALLKAITQKQESKEPIFLAEKVDFRTIPSVYLTKEIEVQEGQKMVRWETKRGCPYRCSFCAHRDLVYNKVFCHSQDKILEELAFFQARRVKKVNVLDPVFNIHCQNEISYLEVLQKIHRIGMTSQFSFQARFENIQGEEGKHFLSLCSEIGAYLEFGIQTLNPKECQIIQRQNDLDLIQEKIRYLNDHHIAYEVSLIYGLPNQTLASFQTNIDLLHRWGCNKIKAWPLLLLKGTELYALRDQWKLHEKAMEGFHIPVVVASDSFTEEEWLKMEELADSLEKNGR